MLDHLLTRVNLSNSPARRACSVSGLFCLMITMVHSQITQEDQTNLTGELSCLLTDRILCMIGSLTG